MNLQILIYTPVHPVQTHTQTVLLSKTFPDIVEKRALDLESNYMGPTHDSLLPGHGMSLNLSILIIKMVKIISTRKHCYENQMQLV